MPYVMEIDGMAEISRQLDQLAEAAPKVAAMALYDGAGIMADEVRKQAAGIKTAPFQYAKGGKTRLPSPEEKEIVTQASAGIAKFSKNGTEVDTSVGFRNAGYATLKGKKKPVPQIVNAINSGTSFMNKQPFIRKAANSGREKALNAMKKVIETELEAITK